jgi:hypothetical protein
MLHLYGGPAITAWAVSLPDLKKALTGPVFSPKSILVLNRLG